MDALKAFDILAKLDMSALKEVSGASDALLTDYQKFLALKVATSDFDAAMAVVPPSGDRFAPRPSSFGDNDLSSDLYD